MTSPTDTLSGAYATGKLVLDDGSEQPVLVRRIPRGDGSIATMVVDDSVIELERRFANTDMAPHDHAPPVTEVLVRRGDPETISNEASTRIRMVSADLVQFVGDPDRILANKALDPEKLAHLKAHPSSATMARRLCTVIGGKWGQVAQYIPAFYPARSGG